MNYLLDTNVVIDYTNDMLPEKSAALIESNPSRISVITRMELLSWKKSTQEQFEILNSFIEDSIVYDLVEPVILNAILIRRNYNVKLPDAIIAATAIVYGLTLQTRNISDFSNIPDLSIINPHQV